MVGEREDLIPCCVVSVHDIGSREAIAGIVGLSSMGMEIALKLVHSSPINISIWVVGYSRSHVLTIHYLDIHRAVRPGGRAIEFEVQIEAINATFGR